MTPNGQRAIADERGAILLIALFFSVFAVAILYSVVSTGETLLFREHLQDGADASALSGAVMQARCMNFIVLINIVMAALLAILVTIKLVEALCILGMALAAALAWITAGATLVAIPPLKSVHSTMKEAYDSVKPPIFTALEVLHDAADTVRDVAPVAAAAMATGEAQAQPSVKGGFAAPSRLTLPVEDDSFNSLCGKGGEYATALALLPFDPIPGVSEFKGDLDSAVGDMTEAMSEWFCGDGSNGPPKFKRFVDRSYPRTLDKNGKDPCEVSSDTEGTGKDATSPTCDAQKRDEEDAKPDEKTGECQSGHDCSLGGPYDLRVAAAREQCDPEKSPAPIKYWYQQRRGRVNYVWNGKIWERQEPRYETPVKRDSGRRPPCGAQKRDPVVATGYALKVHPGIDVHEVVPVCTTEQRPEVTLPAPVRGQSRTVEFTEVENILGCRRHEELPIDVSGGESAGGSDDGNSKSPKRLEAGVKLGAGDFQLRSLVQGNIAALEAGRVVRLSLWDAPEPNNPLAALTKLGGSAMAQSEYFYDGDGGSDAWMWNMNWRARLVRFRLPDRKSDARKELDAACSRGLGGTCSDLLGAVDHFGGLIAH